MPAPEGRRQPAAVRREQILDAAEAVMLRQGLNHATVADVAEAAGLGKGTVYRAKVAAAGTAPEQLRAAVGSFVVAAIRRPDLHHLLFQEAGGDEAVAFAPVRAVFAEIVNAGAFDVANRELAVDYVLGGVHAVWNLVGACRSCNSSKGNKLLSHWRNARHS